VVEDVRERLARLLAAERASFHRRHPRSRALHEAAGTSLLAGVPMSWMAIWAGGHPVYLDEARGAWLRDVDGNEFVDFCLGDTGAMAGHSPAASVAALVERAERRGGLTAMLPSEDATWVGAELARRFGLPLWQFTLTATDANRFVLRMCRQVQQRPKVLVFNWCYHGTVDETVIVLDAEGRPRSKPGNVGPQVDPVETTRVVELNDVEALREALAPRDVACVLMEPWLTNIGIVPAEPGYLDEVRRLCDETGTLLVIDETHTLSAGPGGCTKAFGLRPDVVTLGKALAAGVPIGAYGVSAELGRRILADPDADLVDQGGIGGTLAGNALSLAVARATLAEVLTDEAFERMEALATRFREGVEATFARYGAPWCVVQLGARVEYRFRPAVPRNGGEAAAAGDPALDEYLHLYLLNRGVLMTPFHNMALMCPATTEADVDRHSEVFDEAVGALLA
jgi:glutamate-1-semialdehyde 2,1-aminomutase